MRLAALIALLIACPAMARDLGQWGNADPDLRAWFNQQHNQRGELCCDTADGRRVEDPNWRIEAGGSYSVLIEQGWRPVPPELVVKGSNRAGFAIVWMWPPHDPVIRCFMPGAVS